MAKAPTPGLHSQATTPSFNIGYSGRSWSFNIGEVAPLDVADLRRATGLTMRDVLSSDLSSIDLDIAAALIFLARRQSENRRIRFDDAVVGFTYGTPLEFEAVDDSAEDGDDHPEA